MPPYEELTAIAADWGIPVIEAKAVVGFGASDGLDGFGPDTDDELIAQLPPGTSFDELSAIAQEWDVAVPTVKMLEALGAPVGAARPDGC